MFNKSKQITWLRGCTYVPEAGVFSACVWSVKERSWLSYKRSSFTTFVIMRNKHLWSDLVEKLHSWFWLHDAVSFKSNKTKCFQSHIHLLLEMFSGLSEWENKGWGCCVVIRFVSITCQNDKYGRGQSEQWAVQSTSVSTNKQFLLKRQL